MDIRAMLSADVASAVRIHIGSFQGFFLSFLGPRFLRELYTGILKDPSGIAYVSKTDGYVIGFVAGSDQPIGLYRRLLIKYWWKFGLAALPAFIRKPSVLPRLIRAMKMPNQALPADRCGTLMSIAVDRTTQGQGVGKKLVHAFLVEGRKEGTRVRKSINRCN